MTDAVYTVTRMSISVYGYKMAKVEVISAATGSATTVTFPEPFKPIAKIVGDTVTAINNGTGTLATTDAAGTAVFFLGR